MPVKTSTLKRLVKAYGKTMKEFIVEDMDMTEPAFYRAIQRGKIRINYIQNAAKALGVDIKEIYDFGEEDTRAEEQSGIYDSTNPQNQNHMLQTMFEELQKSLEFYREELRRRDKQIDELINRNREDFNQSTGTEG